MTSASNPVKKPEGPSNSVKKPEGRSNPVKKPEAGLGYAGDHINSAETRGRAISVEFYTSKSVQKYVWNEQ